MNESIPENNGKSNAVLEAEELLRQSDVTPIPDPASPLDRPLREIPRIKFVDDYADLVSELIGSPRDFSLLVGLSIVSTVAGSRATLMTARGDIIKPNVYGMIVAASTVYGKSSTMKWANRMLKAAGLDELIGPNNFSTEGLIRILADTPSTLIVKDELARFLDSKRIPRHLATIKQDLTDIYDGQPIKKSLSAENTEVGDNCVSLLGATTPARFADAVGHMDWTDGFLARFVFVTTEGEPNWNECRAWDRKCQREADLRADELKKIASQAKTQFTIDGDAAMRFSQWRRDSIRSAYEQTGGDDAITSLIGRHAAYAEKFSLISACLSRHWGKVALEDIELGIMLAERFMRHAHMLREATQDYGVSGSKIQRVFQYLQRYRSKENANPKGPSVGEIQRDCSMNAAELNPVLAEMKLQGVVIAEKSGRGERFSPAVSELQAKRWGNG